MLMSRSGSLTPTSPLPDDPVITKTTDLLDHAAFVEQPAVERTALDTDSYMQAAKALQAFISGSFVTVSYFHDLADGGKTVRSHVMDMPTERSGVHDSFLWIKNMELKLEQPWDYTTNDNGEIDITGQAVTYPGITPSIGDVFFATIGDGLVGKFTVVRTTPLSWRKSRIHRIVFSCNQIDDQNKTLFNTYKSRVSNIQIFDRATFLGNTAALLPEEAYKQLMTLRTLRPRMINYYLGKFFDKTWDSIVPMSGDYDPWVVRYIHQKVSFFDHPQMPRQLLPNADYKFDYTIWSRFLDRFDLTLNGIYQWQRRQSYRLQTNSVGFTPLVNRYYTDIETTEKSDDPSQTGGYVFSPGFYAGNMDPDSPDHMSEYEQLVYQSVTVRRFTDVGELIDEWLAKYHLLPQDEQFFKIPVYIHLIDTAIIQLTGA